MIIMRMYIEKLKKLKKLNPTHNIVDGRVPWLL
jgi:hypothetical protein